MCDLNEGKLKTTQFSCRLCLSHYLFLCFRVTWRSSEGLGLILFPPRSEKSLIFLYFHFIFLIERLWNVLALSLGSLNLVTLIQGKIPSEQKWIDDQICIFASQSVFVCGTCNLGKNPYLPWRQAQMNTNFLPKFSEANNLCINVFYIKPFFR